MRLRQIFFILLLTATALVFVFVLSTQRSNIPAQFEKILIVDEIDTAKPTKCPDILVGMTKGQWQTRPLTAFEQMSMDAYLQTERSAFKIPATFQRPDGQCGANITYSHTPQYNHMWFKSVCDHRGSTPCCKDDRCVDLPVEECRCPTCYDERQVIYAEFSKWLPTDVRCQPAGFTKQEACRLLNGSTIYAVGDSYVREVYIALAIILTGNHVDGALKADLPREERNQCLGLFQVTGAPCRYALDEDRAVCDGTVKIKYVEVWNAGDVWTMHSITRELNLQEKTHVIMGLGIHDNFDTHAMEKTFFNPLFEVYDSLPSPTGESEKEKKNEGDKANEKRNIKEEKEGGEEKKKKEGGEVRKEKKIKEGGEGSEDEKKKEGGKDEKKKEGDETSKEKKIKDGGDVIEAIKEVQKEEGKSSDEEKNKEGGERGKSSGSSYNPFRATHHQLRAVQERNATTASAPLINEIKSSQSKHFVHNKGPKWPQLFWMGIHAPGLLKSPHFYAQTAEGVQSYNTKVGEILKQHKVPHLNTFDFTNGVSSFDGTHYGWAINMLKVDMFLTYIRETLGQNGVLKEQT